MTDFSALIERLAALQVGNEAVDREVLAACNVSWSSDEDGQFGGYGLLPIRRRVTRSWDAALLLLPEGTNCHGYELSPSGVEAFVSRNCVPDGHWLSVGQHPTSPAIALCIAVLKAKIHG